MKEIVRVKREAERLKILYKTTIEKLKNKKDLYGPTPPSIFVGAYGYPKVNLGSLISTRELQFPDDPRIWNLERISEEDIIRYKLSLINARKKVYVYVGKINDKFYQDVVESVLSIKPVYVEAKLKKLLAPKIFFKPISPSAIVEKYSLTENPKIPIIVEKYVEDSIKSEEAIINLYNKGFSEYYLSRLLSLGLFGNYPNRKLVPSRWAITAVHNILIKHFEKKIRKNDTTQSYIIFHEKFYGNDFYILLIPSNTIRFELLEAHQPYSVYNQKEKILYGKDDESGGFFAAKLSFLEFLHKSKIKASAIVFRIVTREYKIPLGVWVVREGTRNAFNNKIKQFEKFSEAIEWLKGTLSKKYGLNIYKLLRFSDIFKEYRVQSNLIKFLHKDQNF